MHLIESQATQVAQFIDTPKIYEKYFPLPFNEKYIVFAPHSKESKTYDYWQDVLHIIIPIFTEHKIRIIQVGANNERPYGGCYHVMGQTNVNQVAFLIKNSIGVLSTDTFAQHIADTYNIKSVMLCSNNYKDNVKGYFHPENQIVLEPPRENGEKPCFSLQEMPKSINRIKCEDIAAAICNALNINYTYQYDTVYFGDTSFATMLESACDSIINPQQFGAPSIIMRMDYNFDENILAQQMQICEVSIITNKEINISLITNFRSRIKEVIYIIESINNHNPDFIVHVQGLGIPCRILSTLPQEDINKIKLDYYEIGIIHKKNVIKPLDVKELKDVDISKLYVKSNKFTIGRNKLYNSKAAYKLDKPIKAFEEITPIIDSEDFWEDLPSLRILNKKVTKSV